VTKLTWAWKQWASDKIDDGGVTEVIIVDDSGGGVGGIRKGSSSQ
jgi:hypothetical protein